MCRFTSCTGQCCVLMRNPWKLPFHRRGWAAIPKLGVFLGQSSMERGFNPEP